MSERSGPADLRRALDDAAAPERHVGAHRPGEDPLLAFGPNAADHLRRTDGFRHCPDVLVNCMYDSGANEVAPFEEFMGSHGGLGGWQSRPFALVPSGWSEERASIVGVEAMHDTLRGWLTESGLELKPHASTAPSDTEGG